jgi:hypothetical protein
LLESQKMSMASWDIDTYLKQTVSPNPASLFEVTDVEKQRV